MRIFKKGFNEGQDGPGNRLVFHMQGCNFTCPWCANPEGISLCPKNTACEDLPDIKVVELCQKSKPLFYGGGGATFTGGEPTLQWESLIFVLSGLKEHGISTALETNGSHPLLPRLFPLVDYLFIDCKHWNNDEHKHFTGAENYTVIQNLQAASKRKRGVVVRIPVINGFNASEKDINGFAALLAPLGLPVELMRYHDFGRAKAAAEGREYGTQNGFIDDNLWKTLLSGFKAAGISIINT